MYMGVASALLGTFESLVPTNSGSIYYKRVLEKAHCVVGGLTNQASMYMAASLLKHCPCTRAMFKGSAHVLVVITTRAEKHPGNGCFF